jgi:hypothetical protein
VTQKSDPNFEPLVTSVVDAVARRHKSVIGEDGRLSSELKAELIAISRNRATATPAYIPVWLRRLTPLLITILKADVVAGTTLLIAMTVLAPIDGIVTKTFVIGLLGAATSTGLWILARKSPRGGIVGC